MFIPASLVPDLLRRQPPFRWHVAGIVALLGAFAGLTWWAAASISAEIGTGQMELTRHARQRVLVASVQEQLVEARRVEAAMLRVGGERSGGYLRWDKAVASARRSLLSLYGLAGPGERSLAQDAMRQLDTYSGLLNRAWLPPDAPGAPPNPAPLISRASDHMIGLLGNVAHLGIVARTRTEVAQSTLRSVLHSAASIATTGGLWVSGSLLLVAAAGALGVFPRSRSGGTRQSD